MSLKRQTLWSMAPLLVITVINIVSVPLFYRYLGAEMYALWFYVQTLSGSFGFMDLGLGVAAGRYIGISLGRGDHAAIREYWGTANSIAIPLLAGMALLFTGLGFYLGPKWFNVAPQNTSLLRWAFVAGGLGLFLSYYGQFWNILSQAHLDYKFIGLLRTGIVVPQVAVALALAYWTSNPLLLISWSALIALLQLAIYMLHARQTYGLGLAFRFFRWARTTEMSSFTAKTFGALLCGTIFNSIDRLVLGRLAPSADFAHYTIAANAGARVQGLSGAVMGPVFCNTSIALDKPSGPAAIYNEAFSLVFGWFLLVALWSAVWYPVALTVWLGPDMARGIGAVFPLLMAGFCLNAVANISASQLGPLNRVGTQAIFQVATGLFTVLCIYLGWKSFGLVGVAIGYLVGRAGDLVQDLYVIRLIGGGGWLARSTWRMVLIQVSVAVVFYAIYRTTDTQLWISAGVAAAHAALIAVYLLVSRPTA